MHRAAQHEQPFDGSDPHIRRAAPRPVRSRHHRRLIVCVAAAVPVLFLGAACSSGSDDASKGSTAATSPSPSASTSAGGGASANSGAGAITQTAYDTLPSSCSTLSKKTLETLVPKGVKSGKAGSADEAGSRVSCSWSSLANNGVKGSQFRWLNVSLLRFENSDTRGSGEQLAKDFYAKQVQEAQSVDEAKNVKTAAVADTGDQATVVRYDLKKKEGAFKQQTVVARVENVVVTVDYNGAGLAGDKTPNADDLAKLAEKAAEEVITAVSTANGSGDGKTGSGTGSGTSSSPTPTKSASKSPSKSPTKSASTSASPTPTPTKSTSKG
ncbi:hypothetical protein OK074_4019 [Actinobacteria bacterium OK074]|nr:hypothetical protein OK074_4019 [Actinobacteria bacterium OK074]